MGCRTGGWGCFSIVLISANTVEPHQYIVTYGPKKLDRINRVAMLKRVFYMKMHGGFCEAPKKSGRNNEVAVLPRWWNGGVSL